MLGFNMRELSSTSTYYISRAVFQLILHQALTQPEGQDFLGLLGCTGVQAHTLDKAVILTSVSHVDSVLQQWQQDNAVCVGVFLMQGAALPESIRDKIPNTYVRLAVKLDEKGRLDMLSTLCDLGANTESILPLCLIEDGQQVTYA